MSTRAEITPLAFPPGRPIPSDLRQLARRLFWWKSPEEALAYPIRFLAQVMTLGTWDDLQVARRYWSEADFRAVLTAPPPGVFDARSWTYWHCVFDIQPVPPRPHRQLS